MSPNTEPQALEVFCKYPIKVNVLVVDSVSGDNFWMILILKFVGFKVVEFQVPKML